MSIYQLTNQGNMEYKLDIEYNKIIYLSQGKADMIKDTPVDEKKIFNIIISIGELINNLGNISMKECLDKWHFKSGGKQLYIDKIEKEFIENALRVYNENKYYPDDSTYKQDVININKKINKLIKMTGIRHFDDYNKVLPYLENSFSDFFEECHILYEINNILKSINENKMPISKLWYFENTKCKTLTLSEIYDITKNIVNNYFVLTPLIQYDNIHNVPYYAFNSIFQVAFFHLLSCVTLTQSKFTKGMRTNICELCGYIYIKTGNNSKYCEDCRKIAEAKKKKKKRLKKAQNKKSKIGQTIE